MFDNEYGVILVQNIGLCGGEVLVLGGGEDFFFERKLTKIYCDFFG